MNLEFLTHSSLSSTVLLLSVLYCNPCHHSLGSLEGISPAQMYCANLNSAISFLPSFVVICSLNETYILFILVFSYPVLFCFFFFLSSTFPLSFFVYPLFSLSPSVSFFDCLLLFFLPGFCYSPLIFFVYPILSLFASVSFFCLLLFFWLSPTFFLCLLSTIFLLLLSFTFHFYYYYRYSSVLLFCVFYLSVFCLAFLFCFSYFFISALFNYLVLILDFNYGNFPLIFIFSISLCFSDFSHKGHYCVSIIPFIVAVHFFSNCNLDSPRLTLGHY